MKDAGKTALLYTMDDKYAMQAGVSLTSLFENNRESRFRLIILSDNIKSGNKEKLERLARKYDNTIDIIEMPDMESIAGVKLSTYGWAKAAYCRLFLCDVIPDDVERLIYIDPDTVILGDISHLISTLNSMEFENHYVAACIDSDSSYKRAHTFETREYYYNTGVMLINLKAWRNNEVRQVILNEIKRRNGKTIDVDQSYINCIMFKRIMTLPVRYNVMSLYFQGYDAFLKKSGFSSEETYSREDIEDAINNPVIVHFAGVKEYRPWYANCKHSMKDKWMDYLAKTEWRDFVPTETAPVQNDSVMENIKKKVARILMKSPKLAKTIIMLRTRYIYGFTVKRFN